MLRFEFEGLKDVLINYDPKAQAAYIKVRGGRVAKTKERNPGLNVDLDSHGNLLGLEIIDPQKIEMTIFKRIAKEFKIPGLEHFNPRALSRIYSYA